MFMWLSYCDFGLVGFLIPAHLAPPSAAVALRPRVNLARSLVWLPTSSIMEVTEK